MGQDEACVKKGLAMILCFDIGGSRIKAALAKGDALLPLGEVATPTDNLDQFLAALVGFSQPNMIGVAVSIAGAIGPVSKIANIPCLNGTDVQAVFSGAFPCPVLVLNDADAFALAEAGHGAGRGFSRVFAIILGSGVGGGIVLEGQVIAGAGEWGHGPIVQNPAWPCGCGQTGCLDTVGSARGLERLGDGRATDIVRDWEQGGTDPAVPHWLDLVSGPLAMAINLLSADIVPVGGGLANAPRLIAALDHAVRGKILRQTNAPIVVCAQTSVDAGLLGAAMAGRRQFGRRQFGQRQFGRIDSGQIYADSDAKD